MAGSGSSRDAEIFLPVESLAAFKVAEPKKKIEALKAAFFPPLEFLVEYSLNLIKEIYEVEPDETMTRVYKPSNRKNAEVNTVSDVAYVGISGQRRNSTQDSPLSFTNREGKKIYIHPTYLTFDVYASGVVAVSFLPFRQSVEPRFALQVCRLMHENLEMLSEIFENTEILHSSTFSQSSTDFASLFQDKNFNPRNWRDIHAIELHSYAYDLPLTQQQSWELAQTFVAFYPLLDTLVRIGNGEEPRLAQLLERFNHYWDNGCELDPVNKNAQPRLVIDDQPGQEFEENSVDLHPDDSELAIPLAHGNVPAFPESFEDARQRIDASVVTRPGQAAFRQDLIRLYDRQCAITDCNVEVALEAAHIIPYFGEAANHPANGLLLRRDIHSLFDLYLLSINPDTYSVELSSELDNTCYRSLQGRVIKFPKEQTFKPSQSALKQHYTKFIAQRG